MSSGGGQKKTRRQERKWRTGRRIGARSRKAGGRSDGEVLPLPRHGVLAVADVVAEPLLALPQALGGKHEGVELHPSLPPGHPPLADHEVLEFGIIRMSMPSRVVLSVPIKEELRPTHPVPIFAGEPFAVAVGEQLPHLVGAGFGHVVQPRVPVRGHKGGVGVVGRALRELHPAGLQCRSIGAGPVLVPHLIDTDQLAVVTLQVKGLPLTPHHQAKPQQAALDAQLLGLVLHEVPERDEAEELPALRGVDHSDTVLAEVTEPGVLLVALVLGLLLGLEVPQLGLGRGNSDGLHPPPGLRGGPRGDNGDPSGKPPGDVPHLFSYIALG
eukprot:RCo024490